MIELISVTVAFAGPAIIAGLMIEPMRALLVRAGMSVRSVSGDYVPTAGGILIPISILPALVALSLLDPLVVPTWTSFALAITGFAGLGLIDDVLGRNGPRGWKGHLSSLANWHINTGVIKLSYGLILALMLTLARTRSPLEVALDVFIIAGLSDAVNLVDTGPGRAGRFSFALLVIASVLVITTGVNSDLPPQSSLLLLATITGALVSFYPADSSCHIMMGDTGAYAIGGYLGAVLASGSALYVKPVIAVFIAALHIAAIVFPLRKLSVACHDYIMRKIAQSEREDGGR